MTLTRELRTSIAFTLAILLALTAFVVGNQRHVQATLATEILCLVDQVGDEGDGNAGIFPMFEQNCADQGGEVIDWCPNIPGTQNQSDLPCSVPPQCNDGIDNDGDGKTDWDIPGGHGDPGCSTPTDDNEIDDPTPVAQCQDGIDNDGDGLIDMNDPGCSSSTDTDESNGNGGGGSGADLAVSKTVSDTSPTPSSTVVYTITVTSAGPASTTNVRVTDMLPVGVSYVSDSASGAYATSTGIWTIGTMASGTTATLTITAMVMATTGVEVINTASVSNSGSSDPNSANNTASVSFTSTEDGQGGGGSNDDDGDSSGGSSHHHRSSGGSSNNNGEVLGAETECPMYLTSYIKYGANNDMGEVARLQVFLNDFEANMLAVTGIYDAPTLAAVHAFQRKYATDVLEPWGITGSTGYVYYTTQKQINTIYCKFQKDFPLSISQIEEMVHARAIQPTIRAQGPGATAGAATVDTGKGGPARAVGSVVLPETTIDENAGKTPVGKSQTATTANASSTQGWFTRFVNWLFGR